MKLQKLTLHPRLTDVFNESGEEIVSFGDPIEFTARVGWGSGSEKWEPQRNEGVVEIKIYLRKIIPVSYLDELTYQGKRWIITAPPENWENSRGYRDLQMISARYSEG